MLASTMLALIFCADLHQVGNYHEVLSCMSGRITQQLAGVSIMCTCFGISVTYLVIIGDQFDRGTSLFPNLYLLSLFNV